MHQRVQTNSNPNLNPLLERASHIWLVLAIERFGVFATV